MNIVKKDTYLPHFINSSKSDLYYLNENKSDTPLAGIKFTSNLILYCCYHSIIDSRSQPYSNAILTLIEIFYWYRPEKMETEFGLNYTNIIFLELNNLGIQGKKCCLKLIYDMESLV